MYMLYLISLKGIRFSVPVSLGCWVNHILVHFKCINIALGIWTTCTIEEKCPPNVLLQRPRVIKKNTLEVTHIVQKTVNKRLSYTKHAAINDCSVKKNLDWKNRLSP